MKSTLVRTGNVRVAILNPDGTVREWCKLHNMYSNAWLNALRDAWKGSVTDLRIKYMAWGSDNTAESAAHTHLLAEFGRKAITNQTDGGDGELTTITYVAPYEATAHTINELGWFAGATASATTDSGIMVARVLYNRAKTNLESLQVERTDSIAEA